MTHIEGHKKIHLIGIGGCSMNGLAQILRARGYQVQGSDSTTSPFTERLGELGIPVAIGQKAAYFTGTKHFVNIVEGGGMYGFDGICRLCARIEEAFLTARDPRNYIQQKGLGCESCL